MLKLNIQRTKIMASGPITSWPTDGGTTEAVRNVILLGSKITADDILAYLCTGIFCHPYQEDCKHNHTNAHIHTDIIYTDIS